MYHRYEISITRHILALHVPIPSSLTAPAESIPDKPFQHDFAASDLLTAVFSINTVRAVPGLFSPALPSSTSNMSSTTLVELFVEIRGF